MRLPGFEIARIEAWIGANVEALVPPLLWEPFRSGHSNLTCAITDAEGRRAVIRRPPLGRLLPKAHDMRREWTLITALRMTHVPVPSPIAFCSDEGVTGAPFYIMARVDGQALFSAEDTERLVSFEQRTRLANDYIDVLAELHAIEPATIGLGDLGKADSYVGRQVTTWYKSWLASVEAAHYDHPLAHELKGLLLTHLPDQGPARLVHGDYGFHNCLIGENAAIRAIIDWEISTLGDPLADLAYALTPFADAFSDRGVGPASIVGFPTRADLARRYAARIHRDLADLDYYFGFNLWKTAAITQGVHARYVGGKKSSEGVDLGALRDAIDRALALAQAKLSRWTMERRA